MTSRKVPIRVLIADDHEIFRTGLLHILYTRDQNNFNVIAEAENLSQLIALTGQLNPDIIISGISLIPDHHPHITKIINPHTARPAVIAVLHSIEKIALAHMLEIGVKGYLLKNSSAKTIIEAITAVSQGQEYYCSHAARFLLDVFVPARQHKTNQSPNTNLSGKEIEIIKLICQQLTTKEIAHHLRISKRTVEDCSKRIKEKTGAKSIVGIVLHAVKNKIIPISEI